MLTLDEIESGLFVTHKNTGLRYSVVEAEEGEVLLSPEQEGLQDLTVPLDLFRNEFVNTDRFRAPGGGRRGGRGRKRTPTAGGGPSAAPSGPKIRGKIKKMVPIWWNTWSRKDRAVPGPNTSDMHRPKPPPPAEPHPANRIDLMESAGSRTLPAWLRPILPSLPIPAHFPRNG